MFGQKGQAIRQKCFISFYAKDDVKDSVDRLICSHNFARKVELIMPVRNVSLSGMPKNFASYHVECGLIKFLTAPFLDTFIKKGDCTVLSKGKIDQQDISAIVNGVLYLSLCKNTYERAGLLGSRCKNNKDRFVVIYDLRNVSNVTGNAQFDRLIWALNNTLTGRLPFVFTLKDGERSSLLTKIFGSELKCIDIEPLVRNGKQTILPSLAFDTSDEGAFDEWASNLYEWLGLVGLGSDVVDAYRAKGIDKYLSSYEVQDPRGAEDMLVIRWEGGLIPRSIIQTINKIVQDVPFSSITVQGAQDVPVAWKTQEHAFSLNGENQYTIVHIGSSTVTFKLTSY